MISITPQNVSFSYSIPMEESITTVKFQQYALSLPEAPVYWLSIFLSTSRFAMVVQEESGLCRLNDFGYSFLEVSLMCLICLIYARLPRFQKTLTAFLPPNHLDKNAPYVPVSCALGTGF